MEYRGKTDIWLCMQRLANLVEVSMGTRYSNDEFYREEFEKLWEKEELYKDTKYELRNIPVPEEEMILLKERDDNALTWSREKLSAILQV